MEKEEDIKDFENKIILGDCIEVMKKMPPNKIDLIFADPPYNIGIKYHNHNDKMQYEDFIKWCEFHVLSRSNSQTLCHDDTNDESLYSC